MIWTEAKQRRPLVVILVLTALTRLLYLTAYRTDPLSAHLLHDAGRYHEWASALAAGLAWDNGAFYQAPLYPYLVAAIYRLAVPKPMIVYALQMVLGVLTVFLVCKVARRAYGKPAGLAAAGLTALFGPLVFFETKLLSASLVVFLSTLLMERMQAADGSRRDLGWMSPGIVLGLAALTNPGGLLMGPLGTVWILLDRGRPVRRRFLRAACFALAAGIVILPVALRNHRLSGEWILISTNGGVTFYQGNNPNAVGVFSTPPGFSGRIAEQREESRRLAEAETKIAMGDGAVSSFYYRKGLGYLAGDPVHATGLVARKLLLVVANEDQPLEYNQRLDHNWARWLFPVPFALILALTVVRLVIRRDSDRSARAETPVLMQVSTQLIVLLAFYVSGRYRLPIVPGLAAIAGHGAVVLWRGLVGRERRAVAAAAMAATIAGLSLAYVPLTRGELRRQQLAMAYVDRAAALWSAGRRDDAVEAMRRSLDLDPIFAERHLDLGQVLYQLGRFDEAEAAVREALRRDPDSMEALFLLGVLFIEQQRFEEAVPVFVDLLERDPTNENTANNLLGVLIQLDRFSEATMLWNQLRERGIVVDPRLEERLSAEFPPDD